MVSVKNSLDETDFAILAHLQVDGRMPFTDIAKALNITGNTVRNRFMRMVEQGTLNIVGRVNPHHAGFHAYAMIHIAIQPSYLIAEVIEQINDFPEVSFIASISGKYDLSVDVVCRDNQHLTNLVTERLHRLPGVIKTKSYLFLKAHKYGQPNLSALRVSSADESSNG